MTKIFIFTGASDADLPTGDPNNLALDVNYMYWDQSNNIVFGGSVAMIPYSALDTATTLNTAVKTWVINELAAQQGYTYNILTDQLFFLSGFVGI